MAKDKAYAAFDQMEDWVSELMAAKKIDILPLLKQGDSYCG